MEHNTAKPAANLERFSLNADEFDTLAASKPVEEAVCDIASLHWDDPAGCWDSLAGAEALACPARPVTTVGVYQYRMGIGGAERVVAEQVRAWTELGLRVVFFADEPREMCSYGLPGGVTWIELPVSEKMGPDSYRERACAIADAVREHGVDVLVHNQWWNPLIGWDALLFKALGVPVCVVCHSIFMLMFHEANPREFDCSRIFRYVDGLVTLSELDKEFWQRFNPQVFQANNPMTVHPDAGKRSSLAGANIVWVGRLSDFDKQPSEAIEIFARVAAVQPGATLTIVGASPSRRAFKALKTLARKLKVEDRVEFADPGTDVERYYRNASVYLTTSRLEGWSLTLAESKAFGLPCVMYELGYLTLAQGRRGIVAVAQGDRDGAAGAICEILDNDELRRELGQEAFEHAQELDAFDLAAFWRDAFDALSLGSPRRDGFDLDDAQWNLLLEGFRESVEKALDAPIASYAKRKALRLAKRSR